MNKREFLIKLLETIDELKEESERGFPILVEGKKDIKSLKNLGIEGDFIEVIGTPIFQIADKLIAEGVREVILLTDFDRRGKRHAKDIIEEFESRGIKVNRKIREKILRYSHGDLKDIEGLYGYILRRRDIYQI